VYLVVGNGGLLQKWQQCLAAGMSKVHGVDKPKLMGSMRLDGHFAFTLHIKSTSDTITGTSDLNTTTMVPAT